MINTKKLQAVLVDYKKDFLPKVWNDEKYKWEAVKHFQNYWDINASDFLNMFLQATAKTANLLASRNFYPRAMIKAFAEKEAETVRTMFVNLFDERMDLTERIKNFQTTSDILLKKYNDGTWKQHYQSTNSISTYLWLRYPDKYYIYKYNICRTVALELESELIPKNDSSPDSMINGFKLYDEICSELTKNNELVQMLQSVLTDSCYPDPALKTLTVDVGFYISQFYSKKTDEPKGFPQDYTYEVYTKLFEQKFLSRQFSYMMVTVLAFLDNVNDAGFAEMRDVVESFKQFYLKRIDNGKKPEKQNAKMFKVKTLADSEIKALMLRQPLHALRGLIDYVEKTDTLHLKKDNAVGLNGKVKKELRKLAYKYLYNYYKEFDVTHLTLAELNNLQKGYAITANDVAAISGQNVVKGIHPIYNEGQKSVIILCTLSGGEYANSWLDEQEKVLKYYLEGRTQKGGAKIYNELTKSNQAVILSKKENYPVHVFVREKQGELFHYEGPFVCERVETEADGSKFFVLKRVLNSLDQPVSSIRTDLSVPEVLTHIYNYIAAKGFTYSEDLIRNFFLSLKTKPFVILAGISGIGKSKLVQLVANAVGANAENGRYTLISVRPDWNDSSDLLGYMNLQGEFKPGPLTQVIMAAKDNPSLPYFVCLDEMNLARVEYYFSDFLSIIESRTLQNGVFSSAPIQIPSKEPYYFPENLYIIGTVNMDETTHSFSRKVLDRANTIELTEVDLGLLPQIREDVDPVILGNNYFKSDYILLKDCLAGAEDFLKEKIKVLEEINSIIAPGGFQVGYRVRDEFCFYLLYNKRWGLLPEKKAIDFQIMQKILPRIQGSDHELKKILEDLKNYCRDHYPESYKKEDFMLRRLLNDGFTSFWP